MDFPAFLVLATFITGMVTLLDAILWRPKRKARIDIEVIDKDKALAVSRVEKGAYLIELSRSLFPVILIVLLVRSFLVEPFRIPSGSMMPTLLIGDFILVNKFTYGLRLPVVDKKIIEIGTPQRGDVIVFRYPENPGIDYIKRVVGIGGDRISYRNKTLHINGQRIEQQFLNTYKGEGSGTIMTGAIERREKLSDSGHHILVGNRLEQGFDFVVPQGEYFVMGDNRDNSHDSRFWGTVTDRQLLGKAFFIWMNWDTKKNGFISWGRPGTIID